MTAIKLKEELKFLIEQEQNTSVLNALLTLLKRQDSQEVLKQKLTSRALRSNEQIARREFLTREDLESERVIVTDVFDSRQNPEKMKG